MCKRFGFSLCRSIPFKKTDLAHMCKRSCRSPLFRTQSHWISFSLLCHLDIDHGLMMSIDNEYHLLFEFDVDDGDFEENGRCVWVTLYQGLLVFN
jgi:hypothetical protein